MAKTKELLNDGFLDYVFTRNVQLPKSIKLTTTDLTVLTNIYGHLYKLGDLYQLLFDEKPHRIDTPAGTINTGDLRAFTWLRYLLAPGDYWKPDGKKSGAYNDTAYCGGTPLALLGARNKHNVPYNTWHEGLDKDNIEEVFKLDLFLGHGLASTEIDRDTGEKKWKRKDGLIKFLGTSENLFDGGTIREIRQLSNHPVTAFTTREIKDQPIRNIEFYNDANPFMRHLIRQTWCWYGMHRSSNMICHWSDWDKFPKDIDTMSEALKTYEPQAASAPEGWANIMKTGKV